MARTLNNEVDVLNIASLDNDIKDSFTRAMITEDVNTTSAAARRYLKGEYFIHTDRYLYKALEDIAAGTAITPDVNAEVVTVSEELVRLFAQSPEGIFEILSNIENTSLASKNYAKGSQFIWTDKKLYEATADIVSGSTFVVGTNVKLADNLTSQIQTLKNNDDAMLNVLGAKNLLPITGKSQTINGITFTVNSDGSVTVNGTASDNVRFVLATNFTIKRGEYILSGCPSGGSLNTYFIDTTFDTSATSTYKSDLGSGVTFTTTTGAFAEVRIYIKSGASVSNIIFSPMLRPASVADDTYVPYTKTNRELTLESEIEDISSHFILNTTNMASATVVAYKVGKVVTFNMTFIPKAGLNNLGNKQFLVIDSGYRPKHKTVSEYDYYPAVWFDDVAASDTSYAVVMRIVGETGSFETPNQKGYNHTTKANSRIFVSGSYEVE